VPEAWVFCVHVPSATPAVDVALKLPLSFTLLPAFVTT
jgi:hypothetical protein